MTATAVRDVTTDPADRAATCGPGGDRFAGTATLVRFALRRDRVRLPAWLAGITALCLWFGAYLPDLASTEEQRRDLSRFMEGGLGAIFGPGYGRDAVTPELYLAGVYGLFFFLLAALMTMLSVSRHTRVDEQAGRTELVRSGAVGPQAVLTAALLLAAGANLALALLLGGAMALNGYGAADGLLFGAGVGAVGLVWAGISAATVQVTEHARAATGAAGAALGAAWTVRAAGDSVGDHGSLLSWFSPLAWSNQTRPYVDGRWWPLLLSVGVASLAAAAGFALSVRRDLGAGLVPARPGRSAAAPWLRSPLAATLRLRRASLVWWTVALAAFGLVFGVLADQITDPENISEDRVEMFGGSLDTLVAGYLGVITVFTVTLAGVMVAQGVQAARSEEVEGRAEAILATPVSRAAWFATHLAVHAVGLIGLLAGAGLVTGIGAALATGEGAHVREVTTAHLAHAPGPLVVLGIAALLVGLVPRAIGAVWGVLGFWLFAGVFGASMELPQGVRNLVPAEHLGQPILDGVSWAPTTVLLGIALCAAAAATMGFHHRDLESP